MVLATLGHSFGWPLARGGSQQLSDALAGFLKGLGAEIYTNSPIESFNQLPKHGITMCDVTPRQMVKLFENHLPAKFRKKLTQYRYGLAAYKIDWALRGPVPWTAKECLSAPTVHLGSSFEEIYASEKACWRNETTERPFVIIVQPSLFDSTRAPDGKHTLWGYCHVPNGSEIDMTERIELQIERFAPGFRDQAIAKHVTTPRDFEMGNANLVGGDINGGLQDLRQMFTRPTISTYSTPIRGVYICSSSTPPGGGVHGMCGYNAARVAIRKDRK